MEDYEGYILPEFPEEHYLGKMDNICPGCYAKHFPGEMACCRKGKVFVPPLKPFPKILQALFDWPKEVVNTLYGMDVEEFRRNLLRYNSLFSFASICYNSVNLKHIGIATAKVQVKWKYKKIHEKRPWKLQGAPYHKPSTLLPSNPDMPAFANFWVYDRQKGIDMRKQHFNGEETQEKVK